GERLPTFDDLPKLEYTARVIQEGMRLYPPVWMLARRSLNADKIGGFEIQPRTLIAVSPYLSHRNPAYFVNPERFDPDRFLPERFAKLPRFAYFPFGGGPHLCIGNHFAMMEAQLILAMTLQRFELASCPNQQVELEPTVTLRPRAGLRMRIFRTATTLLGPASTG
ncbi:MAG: cytochrome P450, partial [Myxococcaceae bacterium]